MKKKVAFCKWPAPFILVLSPVLFFNFALGATISVPTDYPTIQAAIDAASSGDTVRVAQGTYNENIVMKSGVYVIADGANTSIVGTAVTAGVVAFSSVQDAKLDGFRITVGHPIAGSDRAVVFSGDTNETSVLQNCILQDTQYGIFVWSPATATIQNNTLVGGPDEQGIYIGNSPTAPVIRNNIITGYLSGIYVVAGTGSPVPTISHNNLWNNNENYRNYPDQTGIGGNISSAPLFADAENDNYHLTSNSPCKDTGSSQDAPNTDMDRIPRPQGWGYDMGAYEYPVVYCYVEPLGTCDGNSPCYSSIQGAINSSDSDTTIKIAQGIYTENPVLGLSKNLFLSGGWDSTFTTQSSSSTVNAMTIGDGLLTVDGLVIQ